MSITRRTRRKGERYKIDHMSYLGELLGGFYEFLSGYKNNSNCEVEMNLETKSFKPSDEQVRSEFTLRNEKWEHYCDQHKLMKAYHLFKVNVAEAWNRHSQEPQPTNS